MGASRVAADPGGVEKSAIKPKVLTNNSLVRRLREVAHDNKVSALSFAAEGTTLAVGGSDRVTLYDAESGDTSRVIACKSVKAMAYSPDGAIAVCGQHEVVVYDASTGEQRFASNFGDDEIKAVAFSRDGKLAVGGGVQGKKSGTLLLLESDATTGDEIRPNSKAFKADEMILSVDFSPNGSVLAAGGAGKKVVLFDVATGEVRGKVDRGDWVYAVSFSPDSATLAVGGDSATLALCEVVTGEVRLELERDESDDWVRTVAFSPSSTILAVGGRTETVAIYDVTSGVLLKKITCAAPVSALAFSSGGALAVGSSDNKIELWDFATGDVRFGIGHGGTCRAVAFSPDGNTLAVGGNGAKKVVMYHAVWKSTSESDP
jgi:WD40 repeat protein